MEMVIDASRSRSGDSEPINSSFPPSSPIFIPDEKRLDTAIFASAKSPNQRNNSRLSSIRSFLITAARSFLMPGGWSASQSISGHCGVGVDTALLGAAVDHARVHGGDRCRGTRGGHRGAPSRASQGIGAVDRNDANPSQPRILGGRSHLQDRRPCVLTTDRWTLEVEKCRKSSGGELP